MYYITVHKLDSKMFVRYACDKC